MAAVQKITANLWFNGNAKEAVDYYLSVFNDSRVITTTYYPREGLLDFQQPLAGKELTITFDIAGQIFVAINAGSEFHFTEAISLSVACKDQAEIDYLWSKLSHVPESEQCGWCKDKYGLSWQIVPQNMDALMIQSDGQYNQSAWQMMMKMKKLDIAGLSSSDL